MFYQLLYYGQSIRWCASFTWNLTDKKDIESLNDMEVFGKIKMLTTEKYIPEHMSETIKICKKLDYILWK